MGVISQRFLQKGKCSETDVEELFPIFERCVEKANEGGAENVARCGTDFCVRWKILMVARKTHNGLWFLFKLWAHTFNRNGFFLPVVKPFDPINAKAELERMKTLIADRTYKR